MKVTKYVLLIFALLITSHSFAQQDKSYILANTNIDELHRISAENKVKHETIMAEALRMAEENNWPTLNLVGIDKNGQPVYLELDNNDARILTNTDDASAQFPTSGNGLTIGMWEATEGGSSSFRPRHTHQDFSDGQGGSRITHLDGGSGFSFHATHVAGTLIGSPPGAAGVASTGMATQADLDAYDASTDWQDMPTAAANGLLVSNHSYGMTAGWTYDGFVSGSHRWTWTPGTNFTAAGDDANFGAYTGASRNYDIFTANAPFYLPVTSAGNHHNHNPAAGHLVRNGTGGAYVAYNAAIHPVGDAFQASNIPGRGCSTNALAVGNMTKALALNASSSRGAMDDGRIKPDLCGIGTDLTSASNSADNTYGQSTGTSMSAPNVAGALLLLQDGYNMRNGAGAQYMRSATLKGLALHTAVDQGNPGPDYSYGWGLLDAGSAADIIDHDAWVNATSTATLMEETLASGGSTWEYTFRASGTEDLKVTLCYTDPVANNFVALQNDLDMTLQDLTTMTVYQPYVLDPQNPGNNATTGDNDADNIEQIHLNTTTAQDRLYKITINSENPTLFNNQAQNFSIVISGQKSSCHYDIDHTGISLANGTYSAQNDLTSDVTVPSSGTVTYQAGGQIVLKQGFQATQNSYFKAERVVCN